MKKPRKPTAENEVAFQHNFLVRTPLRLGKYEARIFVEALRHIRQGETGHMELPPLNIPVSAIIGKDDSTEAYAAVKAACEALYAKDLNLLPVGASKESIHRTRIVSDIEHIKGSGYIRGNFAPKIKPYLIQLAGNFTSADITTLLTMNPNGQRLYWILKSYATTSANVATVIREETLDNLKLLLLEDASLYPVYAEFVRRVLDPILHPETGEFYRSDVNFRVTWEPVKTGKKVTGIRFSIPREKPRRKQLTKAPEASETAPESTFAAWLADTKDRKLQAAYKGLMEKNQLPVTTAQKVIRWVAEHPEKHPSFYTTRHRIATHKQPVANMRSFALAALNAALGTDFK